MGLPWVRLDSNIASHDKVLDLLAMRDGYRAFSLYVFGLGYSGAHSTDGLVKFSALAVLHGSRRHAEMLVEVGLWEPDRDGWRVHNWAQRQELEAITEGKRAAKRIASEKGNCVRWHGPECWQPGVGCRRES